VAHNRADGYKRSSSPGAVSTRSGSASRPSTPILDRSQSPQAGKSPPHRFGSSGVERPQPVPDVDRVRHGVELGLGQGWYRAETNRVNQDVAAKRRMMAICTAVDDLHLSGRCPARRWTNDPDVFPELNLGIAPFPPQDDQLYVPWPPLFAEDFPDGAEFGMDVDKDVDPEEIKQQTPLGPRGYRRPPQPWTRLIEFSLGGGVEGCCQVFDESTLKAGHLGRVVQGQIQNAYLVEALNAISLRPKLARQLFHSWDIQKSIYIVCLYKNGVRMHVEIDDYVPPPLICDTGDQTANQPTLCCRSEHFPRVLWPSLVEKAYAKACTLRGFAQDSGGWEAIGGGGRLEEALSDLTGGVAGSFSTDDVSQDRLFVYLHELQRDCLFICRVNLSATTKRGFAFDPFSPHIINRAAHHQGGCYVQLFTPSRRIGDGGLSQVVPDELVRRFPEQTKDGFYWLSMPDFHYCFGRIFECRLTNSPDVGIEGMPPTRLPNAYTAMPPGSMAPNMPMPTPGGGMSWLPPGEQPLYFEFVFANAGLITEHNPPEFNVLLPSRPCEVVAVVEQTCQRIKQVGLERKPYCAILLKVLEHVRGNYYSADMVCKSNWMPIRDSMVAFRAESGGLLKIAAEFPPDSEPCDRLIFRCYVSVAGAQVSASTAQMRHLLVKPMGPPIAMKWTLVGCMPPQKMALVNVPMPLPHGYMEDDLDVLKQNGIAAGGQCMLM